MKSDLPLDLSEAEIRYIKSLLPRAEAGMLQLLDPNTGSSIRLHLCANALIPRLTA